jgi:hypothetical protein
MTSEKVLVTLLGFGAGWSGSAEQTPWNVYSTAAVATAAEHPLPSLRDVDQCLYYLSFVIDRDFFVEPRFEPGGAGSNQ